MTSTSPKTNLFVYGILMRNTNERATLQDYRLDFATFATVVPEPGGVTYGALIRDVSASQLRYYDGVEGYNPRDPRGSFYRRVPVTVQTSEGDVAAEVYEMDAGHLASQKAAGNPLVSYLTETMHREYARLGHPIRAHDELDYRLERWGDETAAARRRTRNLWYQDAKP